MLRRWLSRAALGLTLCSFGLCPFGRELVAQESAFTASAQDEPAFSALARRPAEPAAAPSESAGLPAVRASVPAKISAEDEWDPIEPVNRGLFGFNDGLDVWVIEPAARGWKAITPQGLRKSVDRFFSNLRFPVRFVGTLAQGRLLDSGEELGRFVLNTTVGIAGFFDPASLIGLQLNDEDLGQALGSWGLGPGPYVVLPILGIYTVRDLVDLPLGAAASLVPGVNAINAVNTRAGFLAEIREAKAASLDYYSFARNAYLQRRRSQIRDESLEPQEAGDELYEISDEQN
jgi:phospholipid-binding lipoprotein MlaA